MLHGSDVVPGTVLGIASSGCTFGHRFLAPAPLTLKNADEYPDRLEAEAFVMADFARRRQRIVEGVQQAAAAAGGEAVGDDALYDEVTALTEWPVPMTGSFDVEYLQLPKEVIVATLTGHQRYFPIRDASAKLLPKFITVANIVSREPAIVRDGNERVIRPRLADAAFFWHSDRQKTLETRTAALADVVYQRGLGSVLDKSRRVAALAVNISTQLNTGKRPSERAAVLAKCDLLTGMVGEFPELQGIMGRYYALSDGESEEVADAIAEQYLPRFAGDALPVSGTGQVLAIADKLDTLCGVFALGKKPSGNRDPFGLRRAALGVARIAIECRLEFDLVALIDASVRQQPLKAGPNCDDEIYDFIVDRLRALYLDRGDVSSEMFEAVRCRRPGSLLDIDQRLNAVVSFVAHDAAESLAAANKRIANILRQADYVSDEEPDVALFDAAAEKSLFGSLRAARGDLAALLPQRRYAEALTRLAELRQPVDSFFDDVMVMAEDDAVRRNRLALLAQLRAQFLDVADISRLSIAKG
jgi:glycyl-tRNA synthetase beta chain